MRRRKEGNVAKILVIKPNNSLKITSSAKIWTNRGKEIPNKGKELLLWKEN